MCRFTTDGLDSGLEILALSIPGLWADRLKSPLYRKPSLEAALKVRWKKHETDVLAAIKKVSDAIDKRDLAWLSGNLTGSSGRSLESQIVKARADLAALEAKRSFIRDEVVAGLPEWQIMDMQSVSKGLLEPVKLPDDPKTRAAAAGVDLLLWGELFSVKGHTFLTVHIYDAVLDVETANLTSSLDELDFGSSGLDALGEAIPVILGYEPALVRGIPEDPQARVHLTSKEGLDYGTFVGTATWEYLRPGSYRIVADSDAAFPVVKTFDLGAGQKLELPLVRVAKESRMVHLESDPPGASVHDGVLFCGYTPLDLDLAKTGGILVFKMPGHEDRVITVDDLALVPGTATQRTPEGGIAGAGEDGGAPLIATLPGFTAHLKRSVFDWKREVSYRRNVFYDALGWFALSLAPSIVFNALYENVSAAIPSSWTSASSMSYAEYQRLAAEANLYYYVGLGGVVLSAVMFSDAGIKLAEYLGVADAADGR